MTYRAFFTVLLWLLTAAPLAAADIRWADPIAGTFQFAFPADSIGDPIEAAQEVDFTGAPHLRIEGRIAKGDADSLGALLKEELPDFSVDMFNNVVVSLNSDGGDFYEGLAMADMIAGYAVSTFVGPGDRCLSSCAIAFMGGSDIQLRGIPAWPSRYLSDEAMLGFHAPFSEIPSAFQVPEGTPLTEGLTRDMAESFYGQAQSAINEIAGRASRWQMSTDFVFQMLTMDSFVGDTRPPEKRFVLVDTYEALTRIKADLLTARVRYPEVIGGGGAEGACEFLVRANTGRAAYMPIPAKSDWLVNDDVIAEGNFPRRNPDGSPVYTPIETLPGRYPQVVEEGSSRRLVPGSDPEAFFLQGMLSGLGRFDCSVYRGEDGRWYARTYNAEVHFPDGEGTYVRGRGTELVEVKVLDFGKGFPVSRHVSLGPTQSWLRPAVLNADVPQGLPEAMAGIEGPSFDCGGALDPAAEVICEYPALAQADGLMVALYKAARAKTGDAVLAAQRKWIRDRERVCRAERIDLGDPIARANLAHCLLAFTNERVRLLAGQI